MNKEEQSTYSYDKTVTELKFRLTKHSLPRDNDSPLYSGTFQFKNEIVLIPNIEYTFGGWQRTNGDLLITIIPTRRIYNMPKQTKITHKPKHIKEVILNYYKKVGRSFL